MNQLTREDVRERLGNIDQIRDIIFGAQIRDYDNRCLLMIKLWLKEWLKELSVARATQGR